jgi:predicted DNA-binding mobile mystery protein A
VRPSNHLLTLIDQRLAEERLRCRPPTLGWIKTVRKALGMHGGHLAERMHISFQAVAKLEQRELDGKITLNNLRKAARAMNCDLSYSFVPRGGSMATLPAEQARARGAITDEEIKLALTKRDLWDQASLRANCPDTFER